MKTKNTTPEFYIFKPGITTEKILIISIDGESFDRQKKIEKYKFLGYIVYNLQGNKI